MARSAESTASGAAALVARGLLLLLGVGLLGASGCASLADKRAEATYAPTESVIEMVAVLRRHVPDDTYRFAPGTDFSGRNGGLSGPPYSPTYSSEALTSAAWLK